MTKKRLILTQTILGFLSILTFSIAISYHSVFACATDGTNSLDCVEETDGREESDNYYFGADVNVKSDTIVDNSLFLVGNDINTSNEVNGIKFVAGNLIKNSGASEYGLFAGNSLEISGDIEKDLFFLGSAATLTDDLYIGRDVFGTAGTILVKTNLNRNAFLAGSQIVLENITIDGNLSLDAEEVVIKGKVAVKGELKYNEDANIVGLENISYSSVEKTPVITSTTSSQHTFLKKLKSTLLGLAGRIVATLVLVALTMKFSNNILDKFEGKNSWKDLALGLGLILAVPLAAIIAAVTIIGLPLGIITLVFYGLFLYLSTSVTGGVIGDILAKKAFKKADLNLFIKYTVGITLVVLLGLIPVIGGLITAISVCFGFGYLIHSLFRRESKKQPAKK